MFAASVHMSRDRRGRRTPREPVARADDFAPPEPARPKSGHLVRGSVDFEDVLDRLSKGVIVPKPPPEDERPHHIKSDSGTKIS